MSETEFGAMVSPSQEELDTWRSMIDPDSIEGAAFGDIIHRLIDAVNFLREGVRVERVSKEEVTGRAQAKVEPLLAALRDDVIPALVAFRHGVVRNGADVSGLTKQEMSKMMHDALESARAAIAERGDHE